jgi:transglutaminase-like putative cysteine protease
MIYRISQVSRIRYGASVSLARFNLRLRPIDWPGQQIADFALALDPAPVSMVTHLGAYPVNVTRIVIDAPLLSLEIRSSFLATVDDVHPAPETGDPSIATVAAQALKHPDLRPTAPAHYLYPSPLAPVTPAIAAWAASMLPPDAPVLAAALALARTIQADFGYDAAATEADTPVDRAFAIRRGVCQDFAHILIVALRSVGLPAAYASGYLRTIPPPGQPRLAGVDAMHAWVMLWCGPARGWIGLDPTNGIIAGPDHILIAIGRDYGDVSPVDGVFVGAAAQRIDTSVDVMPLD